MKQYAVATKDLLKALTLLATLQANGKVAIIKFWDNKDFTYPKMTSNPELMDYQNWESSYACPITENYLKGINHPVLLDLTENYTNAWFKGDDKELKDIKELYFKSGILPKKELWGSPGKCFPMKKTDYFTIRKDEDYPSSMTNTWYHTWRPIEGIKFAIPEDGYSYGVFICEEELSLGEKMNQITFVQELIEKEYRR